MFRSVSRGSLLSREALFYLKVHPCLANRKTSALSLGDFELILPFRQMVDGMLLDLKDLFGTNDP
jgi:hypothetical protein